MALGRKREQPQGPGPAQAPVSTCLQPKPFIFSSFTMVFSSPCFSGGRVGRVDGPSDYFFPAKLSLAPVCLCMVWKGQSDLGQYPQCLEFRFVVKPTYSGVSQAYFPIPVCH